jgi:hypothetical protein
VKPVAVYPDAERLTVDLLTDLLDEDETPVGTDLPSDWSGSGFIQVQWDGTPIMSHPVAAHATIRVTTWSATPTGAKGLAALAQGLLLSHTGGEGISSIRSLTGILPARDPDTRAPIASFTVRVSTRPLS